MVYQSDTDLTLVYDGTNWTEVSATIAEPRLLYMGKPGICVNSISGLPVWRYQTPSGHTTVITNLTLSSTLAAAGTTIYLGVGDPTTIQFMLYAYVIPLNGTVSIDTYIPLDALDGVVAGITLVDTADFTSGEVSLSISGIED